MSLINTKNISQWPHPRKPTELAGINGKDLAVFKRRIHQKLVVTNLAAAVFKDEVDVLIVLEITVKFYNVDMIK